jgi:hypothetical protein
MFAKLAQIRLHGLGSAQRAWATDGDRTGNSAACLSPIANSHRARRPTFVCRWEKARLSGALECVWQSVAVPATDDPRPKHLLGQVRRLTDWHAPAKQSFRRAAA